MERRVLSNGEELSTASGKAALTCPTAGVVVLRMSGRVSAEVVPGLVQLLDRWHAADPIPTEYFYDLWQMTSYDSPLRVDLTNWHMRHRSTLRALHTAADSRIVRMGVTVANLALGGIIRQHKDPPAFEAALAKALTRSNSG